MKVFRHFVRCHDCNILSMLPIDDYQYCPKCAGSNISLLTIRGTKQELDLLVGSRVDDDIVKRLINRRKKDANKKEI